MSAGHQSSAVWPPDRVFGHATPSKLAMWLFLLSDWFSFAGLLLAYGILRGGSAHWHHPGEPELSIPFTAMLTAVLIGSSVAMLLAQSAAHQHHQRKTSLWLTVTAVCGIAFLTGQYAEWFGILHPGLIREGLVFGQTAYANSFFMVTGFHGFHVLAGAIYVLITLGRNLRKPIAPESVDLVALFWHFVDLIWNLVFVLIYLLPLGAAT